MVTDREGTHLSRCEEVLSMALSGAGQVEESGTVSVRELVRRRLGAETDPWDLALVQRAEAWDQVRMRHLLDSLLAGYPIGAILLCRVVGQSSKIIKVDATGTRHVANAAPLAWQLLDGQQRINALTCLFTDRGRYGRFYVHMTQVREPPGPTSRRRSKDRALAYIVWQDVRDGSDPESSNSEPAADPVDGPPIPDRPRHLDLSCWYRWAEHMPTDELARLLEDLVAGRCDDVGEVLRSIDPGFAAVLDHDAATVAADRLRRLLAAWTKPTIPVLRTEVASPLDVLEVFTRINLGGVQVGGTDVYLAAVKTFWNDAESRLDGVSAATGRVLDRVAALRLISRIASRTLNHGDLLPLTVDRLTGTRGDQLIDVMQQLTTDQTPVRSRLAGFTQWMIEHSRLGYGLRLVDRRLWDEVLSWAIVSVNGNDTWWSSNLETLDAYLLGATLFRYPRVLGDTYRRTALTETLASGIEGEPFPLHRIIEVSRATNRSLSGSRDRIRSLADADDRQWTVNRHTTLVLSIAQRLPYATTDIDWDHIFPAAQANRMWSHSERGRRIHHPDRHHINSAGNFWALDLGANRSLQDKPPKEKFDILQFPRKHNVWYPIWPRDQWALEPDEVDRFVKVDEGLTDDPDSINRAMTTFRELVTQRADRLLKYALSKFPEARLFAADSDLASADAAPQEIPLAAALHVCLPESSSGQRGRTTQVTADHGTPEQSSGWAAHADKLRTVWDAVTRRQFKSTSPTMRVYPIRRNERGFAYLRWIPLRHPRPDLHMAIGVTNRQVESAVTPLWLALSHTAAGFDSARERLIRSDLRSRIVLDRQMLRVPIDIDLTAPEQRIVDEADQQIRRIRAAIQQ